jgi:hypothetical protein
MRRFLGEGRAHWLTLRTFKQSWSDDADSQGEGCHAAARTLLAANTTTLGVLTI